jgi:hypothetical protein
METRVVSRFPTRGSRVRILGLASRILSISGVRVVERTLEEPQQAPRYRHECSQYQ